MTPSARAPLVAVGAALAFLAVDAPLAVHNRVGAAVAAAVAAPATTDDWPTPIVYAPLLAVVAVLVWRHPDRRDHRLAARAGLLVLGAALALRPLAFGAYLVWRARPRGVLRELAVAGQQGLELGGWILVGWALAAAALAAVRAAGARRVG